MAWPAWSYAVLAAVLLVAECSSGTSQQSRSSADGHVCRLATTRGDFDGDGTPDDAALLVVARARETCLQAQSPSTGRPAVQLQTNFGPGGSWQRPFPYCTTGECGETAFTATDLGGRRAVLAVDVGPGAAIDHVELFRVDRDDFRPLQIAPGAKLRAADLEPGPAILGGAFDSGAQSPVSCTLLPDGTHAVVATEAEPLGPSIKGRWRVSRVALQLHGDTLTAIGSTTTTTRGFPIGAAPFHLTCP